MTRHDSTEDTPLAYASTLNTFQENFLAEQEPKTDQEIFERLCYFPNQVLLETSSYCNLNCTMCARQFQPRSWGKMEESLALRVIDEVLTGAPWVRIWFCYFGEPLVSKKLGLYKRIRYAKDRGLKRAAINTNGTLLDERAVRDLLDAGLDEIYIGIDAITKETYESIRLGGKFATVMDNIHRLIQLAGDRIQITVQFAELKENQHELEAFKEYWSHQPVQVYIRPKVTWLNSLEDEVNAPPSLRHACAWLFDSININENGNVPFCICDWRGQQVHGNVREESIFAIWQKKIVPYLVAHAAGDWPKLPDFCRSCPDWQTKKPRNLEVIRLFAGRDPLSGEADVQLQ
ncbi:MAG: radical SAM protein [Magnetococcales bacterium]|nr:radical SAM protein [Magnetococcales bacterium]NGZ29321.1 radical SAM protein [Magnetococcales bacterium]